MPEHKDVLTRLHRALDHASAHHRKLDMYLHGMQPLVALPEKIREESPHLFSMVLNLPRLVVDSYAARLDIEGFRTGSTDESERLWGVWQRNNLDEASTMAHVDALTHGRSFALVWSDEEHRARITVESARQCIAWTQPGSGHILAGLKRWLEPDGSATCVLYLPHEIIRYRTNTQMSVDPLFTESEMFASGVYSYAHYDFASIPSTNWVFDSRTTNPLGQVPLVALENRKRILGWGESELTDIIPIADGINKLLTDMLTSSEYHAMPRRWATGVELPEDEETGQVTSPFDKTPGRTWYSEAEETKFGQFPEASLTNFTEAVTLLIRMVGSVAALPPHYLMLSSEPASADAIRSSEAPLVERVRRKSRIFGGSWERVMRLATRVERGYVPSMYERMETVWRSPESRTRSMDADYALKLRDVGVPPRALLEDLGFSDEEIRRMKLPGDGLISEPSPNGEHKDAHETSRAILREDEVVGR